MNSTFYKDFWEYTPATAQTNPVPLINQPLVPDAIAPGGAGFTLTVNGTGFVSGSVVNWNGSARATTFVSNSQLTVSILVSDIAIASTASVTVVNPSPGGGESNAVFFPITSPTSSVSFKTSEYATGTSPFYPAVGDFNGDSKLDVAVGNAGSNTVSVLLGNGNGTFQAQQTFAAGNAPFALALGDLNGDGKADLAVANELGNSLSVLVGNGNGTFQAQQTFAASTRPPALALGDINGDGKPDLAVANSSSNTVSVLLGNGDAPASLCVVSSTGPPRHMIKGQQ
jgi:hypothetical protein